MAHPDRVIDRAAIEQELRREVLGAGVLDESRALRVLKFAMAEVDAPLRYNKRTGQFHHRRTGKVITPMVEAETPDEWNEVESLIFLVQTEFAHLVDEVHTAEKAKWAAVDAMNELRAAEAARWAS